MSKGFFLYLLDIILNKDCQTNVNMTPNCLGQPIGNHFSSRYRSIKNGIIQRIHREDKKKGPRRNSRLPKKHLHLKYSEQPSDMIKCPSPRLT